MAAQEFQDFAGSILVHAVGGFAGLAAAIVLGSRIGRFNNEGKSTPIPGHNITFAALGVFILWVGWYGFNPGSQLTYSGVSNAGATLMIAVTTTLSAAAGAIVAMSLAWILFGALLPLFASVLRESARNRRHIFARACHVWSKRTCMLVQAGDSGVVRCLSAFAPV
eukprot:TRINITY_DN3380_c0_g1_i17.p2 TRINITY_DN3380_c0_g1~~TRINITY_DN3380_c0_g1_i17.p2  ORF type:complete len:166 (-),score=14.83 TRINITY_DN3380_c0_g1_i17:583-1080(-)